MPKQLSVISWNIHGKNSMNDYSFQYLSEYDIISLVETWTDCDSSVPVIDGYDVYFIHGQRRSRRGRNPGGIAVYVRNTLRQCVKCICKTDFGVYLKIYKAYFTDLEHDIIFPCVYIPCESSTFYDIRNEKNGINEMFDELIDIMSQNDYVILMGDLNARTAEAPDYIIDDNTDYLSLPDWWSADNFSIPRQSRDKHAMNNFGRSLINYCKQFQIHMLNGRSPHDQSGEYTFCSATGQSVVDYILVSSCLFDKITNFSVGTRDESDHFPISCYLLLSCPPRVNDVGQSAFHGQQTPVRFSWENAKLDEYQALLSDHVTADLLNSMASHVERRDVNSAVNAIVEGISTGRVFYETYTEAQT